MTLIEIMIVLAIIAGVMVLGVPRLFKSRENIKTVAREFLVLGKSVRDRARLSNSTYRIVIRIKPNEDAYWVEKASGPQLIDPALMTEEGRQKAEDEAKDKENKPPPLFQIDKSVTKKEKTLPSSLHFVSLETVNMKEPLTEGEGYIYFFPQGFVEASALQIGMNSGNNSSIWTLVFNPLTGQADIIEKAQSLKDVQR